MGGVLTVWPPQWKDFLSVCCLLQNMKEDGKQREDAISSFSLLECNFSEKAGLFHSPLWHVSNYHPSIFLMELTFGWPIIRLTEGPPILSLPLKVYIYEQNDYLWGFIGLGFLCYCEMTPPPPPVFVSPSCLQPFFLVWALDHSSEFWVNWVNVVMPFLPYIATADAAH